MQNDCIGPTCVLFDMSQIACLAATTWTFFPVDYFSDDFMVVLAELGKEPVELELRL